MSHWEPVLSDLVRQRGGALVRYATLLCGDRAEGEDLVQEALTKVFAVMRRPPRGDDGVAVEHAEAYVRRTVLTLYLDGYRRRRRWAAVRHLLPGSESTSGPEKHSPDRLDVDRALAVLGPKQRACMVLRYYADLTVPQIADELGVSPGTVKRHLHDAGLHLVAELDESLEGERR
ncbi:sigma-70 family RNA polymerase sigma factor [Occultella gossypii]|uniref:Sigma-70 family RNA polymerase sigma factor n=1 Tax=Occultella gossypii TaxID=2800820 RepID=A0ABS7SAF0_9MICO|nr:sigma-70 family RNA polymerase sigma factor [Occultella gossypii]MBZ2197312.1 sigma-70 family RNA polymerase sigma factor [Occultella gossypii]